MTSGIYCIERIETGQRYIGKSKNLETRMWNFHPRCKYIESAIKKHGLNAFIRYIVEYCNIEDLTYWEQYYIREWNTKAPNGYNLTDGGEGMLNPGKETRDLMRKAKLGKKASLESILKRSGKNNVNYGKKGKDCHNYGRVQSPETIEKKRKSMLGHKHLEESKELMRKNHNYEKSSILGKKQKNSSSSFFGVSLAKKGRPEWRTRFVENGINVCLGNSFKTQIDAAKAYDECVVENDLIGRQLNFPNDYPDYNYKEGGIK